MDEILNRWSTDLDSSIKEFSRQAAEVAAWDKILLKGGDEISALLNALNEAEEKQANIDRVLDYLEASQNDLTYLVGEYEGQIETLLPSITAGGSGNVNGASIAGPGQNGPGQPLNLTSADVEREKSYQLAETLNAHLDDISKNLGAMINELNSINDVAPSNGANAADSSAALAEKDGNIAQIVAILNAHLGSLKWIDNSSTALRSKLEALRRGQL